MGMIQPSSDRQINKPANPSWSKGHQRSGDLRAWSIRTPVDTNKNSQHLQDEDHHEGQTKPAQQGATPSCLSAGHREDADKRPTLRSMQGHVTDQQTRLMRLEAPRR